KSASASRVAARHETRAAPLFHELRAELRDRAAPNSAYRRCDFAHRLSRNPLRRNPLRRNPLRRNPFPLRLLWSFGFAKRVELRVGAFLQTKLRRPTGRRVGGTDGLK